jgi:hypothetical protein
VRRLKSYQRITLTPVYADSNELLDVLNQPPGPFTKALFGIMGTSSFTGAAILHVHHGMAHKATLGGATRAA